VSDSEPAQLARDIERLYQQGPAADRDRSRMVFKKLRDELSA
jgi:hypothetical protein